MRDSAANRAMAKKRLAIFLAVTFALSWGLWIPLGIVLGAYRNGELATPAIAVPIAAGMFFPLVGALVANRACGADGRIDLGFHPHVRDNVGHYLAAWFAPALITLLGCIVFFAANPHLFDLTFSGFAATIQDTLDASGGASTSDMPSPEELVQMMPLIVAGTIVFSLTIAPFINAIPAFGEEAGWRGLLFPTLCELMPVRAAVVVSGVIWGLWHAPIIAMGHNYGMNYAGFPWTGILVMIAACTALGSFLAYVRVRTKSVWPCALSHGAFNAIANAGLYFCLSGQTLAGPSPLGYLAGIPLFAFGIICWLKMPEA